MSDISQVFVWPNVILDLAVIWICFELFSRHFVVKPRLLLVVGLSFMLLAMFQKDLLLSLHKAFENREFSSVVDLTPAIIFLEVSIAALGGSIAASAFVIKSQLIDHGWKKNLFDKFVLVHGKLRTHRNMLKTLRSEQTTTPPVDYLKKLNGLLDNMEALENELEEIQKLRQETRAF